MNGIYVVLIKTKPKNLWASFGSERYKKYNNNNNKKTKPQEEGGNLVVFVMALVQVVFPDPITRGRAPSRTLWQSPAQQLLGPCRRLVSSCWGATW